MAREVELDELLEQMPRIAKKFKAFEALVRADEREACAKIADEWAVGWPHPSRVIAERIRARGKV